MKRLLILLITIFLFGGSVSAETTLPSPVQNALTSPTNRNAPSKTFIVTNTSDAPDEMIDGTCATTAGVCTLRAAIMEANDTDVADSIHFNIDGDGPHLFQPTSPYPDIDRPLTIDGSTEPAASCPNVLDPADLRIVLDGSLAGSDTIGLQVSGLADNSTIRGLVIINFRHGAINMFSAENVRIECNHIGIAADGVTQAPNGGGVRIGIAASGTVIGGTTDDSRWQRNVISGNWQHGIVVHQSAEDVLITGNYIGTTASGLDRARNIWGIIVHGDEVRIGGSESHHTNTISGNTEEGVLITTSAANITVDNSYIGVNALGIGEIPNREHGIKIFQGDVAVAEPGPNNIAIGSIAPNIIANNLENGVQLSPIDADLSGVTIRHNQIFNNGGLGIELGEDGVTPNDFFDADTGPNGLQNHPHIEKADNTSTAGSAIQQVSVSGSLISKSNRAYTLDFYYSDACDESGHGEGKVYVGSHAVTTNGPQGVAFFDFDFSNVAAPFVVPPVDSFLSATATDSDGNTSEFSQCVIVTDESELLVNSNDDKDDGACNTAHCSLREAIGAANAIDLPESATISFDLSDPLIEIGSALPAITKQVRMLGLSQSGAACPSEEATPGQPLVHLHYVGTSAADGLHLATGSDYSQLSGLVITNFKGDGVRIDSDSTTLHCNYIGIQPDGRTGSGNNESGVHITGQGNTIGGALATLRNVISGNGVHGVYMSAGSSNNVGGNIIGLDAYGNQPVANGGAGVRIEDSRFNLIGGPNSSSRNVLSGNTVNGVFVFNTNQGATIRGNFIGLDMSGENPRGNGRHGIHLAGGLLNGIRENVIGDNGHNGILVDGEAELVTIAENIIGSDVGLSDSVGNGLHGVYVFNSNATTVISNTIAHNTLDGVYLSSGGTRNHVTQNDIHGNGELGIDLGPNGVTENDVDDIDTGSNELQNFPELLAATDAADSLTIFGTLNSIAFGTYTLEFFHNTNAEGCDSTGNGEAGRYIGSHEVSLLFTTEMAFTAELDADVPVGDYVTATATDALGNTSEISDCRVVSGNLPTAIQVRSSSAEILPPSLLFIFTALLFVCTAGVATKRSKQ